MSIMIIIIVVGILIGIVFLSSRSPFKKRTREEFLAELEKFLEGKTEPIPDKEDSYQIKFTFEKQDFIYEDVKVAGFKEDSYESCLKAQTRSNLTLQFTEKERDPIIRAEIIQASAIPDSIAPQEAKLQLPKNLKNFSVFTNDVRRANEVFQDKKVASIFSDYKNVDVRGYAFLSLVIKNGMVILNFHPSGRYNPRPISMLSDIHPLEDYLDKLLVVVRKLNNE